MNLSPWICRRMPRPQRHMPISMTFSEVRCTTIMPSISWLSSLSSRFSPLPLSSSYNLSICLIVHSHSTLACWNDTTLNTHNCTIDSYAVLSVSCLQQLPIWWFLQRSNWFCLQAFCTHYQLASASPFFFFGFGVVTVSNSAHVSIVTSDVQLIHCPSAIYQIPLTKPSSSHTMSGSFAMPSTIITGLFFVGSNKQRVPSGGGCNSKLVSFCGLFAMAESLYGLGVVFMRFKVRFVLVGEEHVSSIEPLEPAAVEDDAQSRTSEQATIAVLSFLACSCWSSTVDTSCSTASPEHKQCWLMANHTTNRSDRMFAHLYQCADDCQLEPIDYRISLNWCRITRTDCQNMCIRRHLCMCA